MLIVFPRLCCSEYQILFCTSRPCLDACFPDVCYAWSSCAQGSPRPCGCEKWREDRCLTSMSSQSSESEPYWRRHWWAALYRTPGSTYCRSSSFLPGGSSRHQPQPRLLSRKTHTSYSSLYSDSIPAKSLILFHFLSSLNSCLWFSSYKLTEKIALPNFYGWVTWCRLKNRLYLWKPAPLLLLSSELTPYDKLGAATH